MKSLIGVDKWENVYKVNNFSHEFNFILELIKYFMTISYPFTIDFYKNLENVGLME